MSTLKDIWKSKGMTVEDVAVKADVSHRTVSRINKKQTVSVKSLRRVCLAVGISIEEYWKLEADVTKGE